MSKTFVIFDTEYTTWEGAMDRGWSGANEYREIVQISAIKIDQESLEEIDQCDILIKPEFNPEVSDFFTQLTGITNKEISQNGIPFKSALIKLNNFISGNRVFSYGNDALILGENMGYYKIEGNFLTSGYLENWASYFHRADPQTKKINSGKLATHFGVADKISGHEHNALYDCRSQLVAFKYLYQKGHKFSF